MKFIVLPYFYCVQILNFLFNVMLSKLWKLICISTGLCYTPWKRLENFVYPNYVRKRIFLLFVALLKIFKFKRLIFSYFSMKHHNIIVTFVIKLFWYLSLVPFYGTPLRCCCYSKHMVAGATSCVIVGLNRVCRLGLRLPTLSNINCYNPY